MNNRFDNRVTAAVKHIDRIGFISNLLNHIQKQYLVKFTALVRNNMIHSGIFQS